ncbi:hypothetical protein Tco_1555278 [Tanacetum coccineum]
MSGKATSAKITISVEATSPDNHMSAVDRRVNIMSGRGTSSKKATLDEPASVKDLSRYLSTDMVLSDARGNAVHCSARSNVAHNFIKLKEGVIYCIKNFVVYPNKEECRIRKDDAFMLEFNGATSARKALAKGGGFVRHPFQFVELDSVELRDNKYMIGLFNNEHALEPWTSTWPTKGVRCLELHYGVGVGDILIEKKTKDVGQLHVILNFLFALPNKLYLLSSSSTKIFDDSNIPALKELRSEIRYRLELGISDATAHVVVVMFDETASELVKCSADSLAQSDEELHLLEPNSPETVLESEGSSTIDAVLDAPRSSGNRLCKQPSVSTPLKPCEGKTPIRQELEDLDADSLSEPWDKPADNPSLANILHKSLFIHSNTIIQRDRKVQSFCGLKIANIGATCADFHSSPTPAVEENTRVAIKQYIAASTSRQPSRRSELRMSCKVCLSKFHDAPPPLNRLLNYTDPTTLKFRDKIRVYNSMFCFTSFGARIDHSINTCMAPYTFRINGQNYHRIGSLLPKEGIQPRQYNKLTVTEVAALITNNFGDGVLTRNIIIDSKDSGPKRISELHPSYMALQYPLLFLYGKDGTPSQIDDIISAEIPCQAEDPEGYKVVTEFMLHGPYGKDAKSASCNIEEKCSKHFPKAFNEETIINADGYPIYHRRDNKSSVTKGKFKYDNKYVLNKRDPAARTLTYAEIPKHYVWHEKPKMWKQRKQQKCIGRIVYSSLASGERYYLRMLLNVVRGPKEFSKLMTVNKRIYPTFKDTCFAYGLLNDDKEWTHAVTPQTGPGPNTCPRA